MKIVVLLVEALDVLEEPMYRMEKWREISGSVENEVGCSATVFKQHLLR